MAARIWTARETQKFLRDLRTNGYIVIKKCEAPRTYEAFDNEGRVFLALRHSWGYAVTLEERIMA